MYIFSSGEVVQILSGALEEKGQLRQVSPFFAQTFPLVQIL